VQHHLDLLPLGHLLLYHLERLDIKVHITYLIIRMGVAVGLVLLDHSIGPIRKLKDMDMDMYSRTDSSTIPMATPTVRLRMRNRVGKLYRMLLPEHPQANHAIHTAERVRRPDLDLLIPHALVRKHLPGAQR
jgi:hypothetical protein